MKSNSMLVISTYFWRISSEKCIKHLSKASFSMSISNIRRIKSEYNYLINLLQIFISFLTIMSHIQKLFSFGQTALSTIQQKTNQDINHLLEQIDLYPAENDNEHPTDQPQINEKFQYENINEFTVKQIQFDEQFPKQNQGKRKGNRLKQIEGEKMRIMDQLKELNEQIDKLHGGKNGQSYFRRREKIQKNQSAQKSAQHFIHELSLQKKQIQEKKKKKIQKKIHLFQKYQEARKKERMDEMSRLKQEKRMIIMSRMQQQQKRKQERKIIQQQSNKIIRQLKNSQKLETQISMDISTVLEVDRKFTRKNHFSVKQIYEHQEKYDRIKQQRKGNKFQSVNIRNLSQKYPQNIWKRKLREEDEKKKLKQFQENERAKKQLEKRVKYGELVKSLFAPKKSISNEKKLITEQSTKIAQKNTNIQKSELPKIPLPKNIQEKRKEKEEQMRRGKIQWRKKMREYTEDHEKSESARKTREKQLRNQTNERLKNYHIIEKPVQASNQKKKYENYLKKIKVNKNGQKSWRKILQDENTTQLEKYEQLRKKADNMESKAKFKEDLGSDRVTSEEAVNLYIGSIQAKLALLDQF